MMSTPRSTVRRLAAHHYEFRSEWTFDCEYAAVYDVLSRLEDYASWWPQVTYSARDGNTGRAVVHLRSALPFTLRFALSRDVEDPEGGHLRAFVRGDIGGFVGWTISPASRGTAVRFDQAVTLEQPVVRKIDMAVRPLLQWNHAVAMRGCARGLERRLLTSSPS